MKKITLAACLAGTTLLASPAFADGIFDGTFTVGAMTGTYSKVDTDDEYDAYVVPMVMYESELLTVTPVSAHVTPDLGIPVQLKAGFEVDYSEHFDDDIDDADTFWDLNLGASTGIGMMMVDGDMSVDATDFGGRQKASLKVGVGAPPVAGINVMAYGGATYMNADYVNHDFDSENGENSIFYSAGVNAATQLSENIMISAVASRDFFSDEIKDLAEVERDGRTEFALMFGWQIK